MKKLPLFVFFFVLTTLSYSQRVYFLYIQSENEQPFYLKMQDHVYHAASKGYLIVSNLRDTSYDFSIGLPGANVAEQKFSVSMKARDHGFLIKNFNEKGWGLFDLQTLSVQMARSDEKAAGDTKKGRVQKDESAFTQILAKASDDSTLLEKPDLTQIKTETKTEIAVVEAPKNAAPKIEEDKSVQPVGETGIKSAEVAQEKKSTTNIPEPPKAVVKEEPQQKTEEPVQTRPEIYKRSEVTRKSESSTTEGFGVTFIDAYGDGSTDTIKILIPQPVETYSADTKELKEEKKFLDIADTIGQTANAEPNNDANLTVQVPAKTTANKNCSAVADESDFFKLRKKMAGIPEDDNMISEARRTFRSKCYSTEQIKNLSTLFLSDGGKYRFFDVAYEYVSDPGNFPSLQAELKGDYYINRFKAMLR